MKNSRLSSFARLLLALLLAASAGCSTLRYRSVQSQFEAAVRADNERFAMPYTDVAGAYRDVAQQLTPENIARLDPKLRPNAWTLRSVSLWRTGDFSAASSNAFEGLAEINRLRDQWPQVEQGRDSIILTMLPGLAEDSRLRDRFKAQGAADVAAHYDEDYVPRFKSAVRALAEAREKVGPPTPLEVVYYWDYQCWRVLNNWSYIISQLPIPSQRNANGEASTFISDTLAHAGLNDVSELLKATQSAQNAIPAEHPYWKLIELEKQR